MMIARAKAAYPGVRFEIQDATDFSLQNHLMLFFPMPLLKFDMKGTSLRTNRSITVRNPVAGLYWKWSIVTNGEHPKC